MEKSGFIEQFFSLKKFDTNYHTEIVAGLSTYLSVAYIFIVNPAILSKAGIDYNAALFATAVAASAATLAMGLWAKLPFAVAPGLTMNGYFVYVVSQKMGLSWQEGLAAVFFSGVVCLILTAIPVRQRIIDSIPLGFKRAIAATVGVFVFAIGLFLAKLIAYGPSGFITSLGLGGGPLAIIFFVGLGLSALLGWRRLRFPAGILVALIACAALYAFLIPNQSQFAKPAGDPFGSVFKLDFGILGDPRFWLPVIIFFVLDFFEGIGEFIGMTANTTIQDKDGNVPNIKQGLYVDGAGTILGSLLGTSSLIIFVESAVGIWAGGRTGLTAVTCGVLMAASAIASYFFAPVIAWIPAEAAAGVLAYVGILLLSNSVVSSAATRIGRFDAIVAVVMGAVSFATFSLDKSLAFGFWAYFLYSLRPGATEKPAWWLAVIGAILTTVIIWQRLDAA
jgi:AGZA family xanthine/uracil permease-like MFS transporter